MNLLVSQEGVSGSRSGRIQEPNTASTLVFTISLEPNPSLMDNQRPSFDTLHMAGHSTAYTTNNMVDRNALSPSGHMPRLPPQIARSQGHVQPHSNPLPQQQVQPRPNPPPQQQSPYEHLQPTLTSEMVCQRISNLLTENLPEWWLQHPYELRVIVRKYFFTHIIFDKISQQMNQVESTPGSSPCAKLGFLVAMAFPTPARSSCLSATGMAATTCVCR